MSAGQFRKVDPDLLADYVGGALDGTRDESLVGRLIMDDPAWAQAHAALSEATGVVRSNLMEWGGTPEPMPLEVADRVTAALAEANLPDTAPDVTVRELTPLAVVPDGTGVPRTPADVRPTRRGVRSRSRWSRWTGPAAVAAAVAAVAGLGITQLTGTDNAERTGAIAASSEPERQEDMRERGPAIASAPSPGSQRIAPPLSANRVVSSGTDYGPSTLSTAVGAPSKDSSTRPLTTQDGPTAPSFPAVPSALQRLADANALSACLDAVTTAHSRGPVMVDLIDYASFQGSPALIVAFANGAAQRWVWVAGPQCGRGETGADTRYSAQVG